MKKKEVTIAASILTANFLSLQDDLFNLQKAGVEWIHFDVMDYHFVPNLSFGPKILHDVCQFNSKIKIDCHMMVTIDTNSVKEYLQPFLIGPQIKNITFHYEALTTAQLREFLTWKNASFKKGLALNPETNISKIYEYLPMLDTILIMSVTPGAGGQKFLPSTITKIETLLNFMKDNYPHLTVAVDGGINEVTASQCLKAGANYLVAGSFLLNSSNAIARQVAKLVTYEK